MTNRHRAADRPRVHAPSAREADVQIVAHRGGTKEFHGQNLEPVAHLAEVGATLEADVSVTADGIPIVWHPRGLARLFTTARYQLLMPSATALALLGG